jgi:hypothetical protein
MGNGATITPNPANLLDILAAKEELKKEIELLRKDMQKDLKETELRLKNDLTIRLGVMLTAGISIVATLVKLL